MSEPDFGRAPFRLNGMGISPVGKKSARRLAHEIRTRWLKAGWSVDVYEKKIGRSWTVRSDLVDGLPGPNALWVGAKSDDATE